jgi:hypothetical protein
MGKRKSGTFPLTSGTGGEPPKPLTGERFKPLDLPPSIPRPEGMTIAKYVMTFPQLLLQHRRRMMLLMLAKYHVRDDGHIAEADLLKLLGAMLPLIVPAFAPANVDENGMPIRSGGRPRLITPRQIATIREKVKQGMSVRAACKSLTSDGNEKHARALAARYHRAMGSQ